MNNQQRVYAFGYNAFQQTGADTQEAALKTPLCHTNIAKILFASWESTIILNDHGDIDIWGYKPTWFDTFTTMCKGKHIRTLFGDIHHNLLGIIDTNNTVSIATPTEIYADWKQHVEDVVYCKEFNALFVLDQDGAVSRCNTLQDSHLLLTKVYSLAASESHVLFHCTGYSPVYAMGSNRFSQLGLDFHQELKVETPLMVEHFCGLMDKTTLSCGPFHSAVAMGGDVYTFGWSKDGRLGWGEQNEDGIALAVFLDVNEQPVEVDAIKVVCGAAHTLVLDADGNVWSCGSNKYGQLGRSIQGESDAYFRMCALFDIKQERAIDCFAG
ncbi:RCC1/BLIP-II, partial [Backusella circina FSU 941]